jgi:cell division protein FtsB
LSRIHRGFHVRQHKPWKLWLALSLLVGLIAMFFFLGKGYQDYRLERLQLERETLLNRIAELETRNQSLVQKNAHLLGGSKIERGAYELANQELVRLQQQLLEQKEELAFYRGIVSPSDTELGVNLQTFEVRKKNNQNQFSYKMILTKNGKSTIKLRGDTSILIRGEKEGDVSVMSISDLALEKAPANTKFAFRYFQVFEGDIALPEGFKPFEVEIGIKPTTKKVESFSETISWTSVLSEGV